MADPVQGQGQPVATPAAFHVPLSEGTEMAIEPDDEQSPETSQDTPEPDKAAAAKATPDDKTPVDEIEFDPNDPAQVAAYEKLRKDLLPKWQKKVESLKKSLTPTPAAKEQAPAIEPGSEATAPAANSAGPLEEFYADPIPKDWTPKSVKGFDKESDLAAYAPELIPFVVDIASQMFSHAMQTMAGRSKALESRQQEAQAAGVIEEYVKSLESHPDFESLYSQLAEIAPGTRALAISDPKRWVKMAVALTGVPQDWHEEQETQQATEQVARGQQSQRLAKKPLAVVQRPTRAAPTQTSPGDGRMTLEDALAQSFKKHGLA